MAEISFPSGRHSVDYSGEKAVLHTHLQWGLAVLGLLLLLTLPLHMGENYFVLLNHIGITIIIALGLHFLTGYCGIINLGQAGFICVGAFFTAILCKAMGLSAWAALPCSVLISGLVGLLFGLCGLRIKGFYLVIATLAAGIIIPPLFRETLLPMFDLPTTGVLMGDLTIGGLIIHSQGDKFFLITAFVLLAIILCINLSRSRIGRIFKSMRDGELVAQSMGVSISSYKLLAFFICCLFGGLGGWLWGFWMPGISTSQFPFTESVWFLAVLVIGGMGSIFGIVVGAVVVRGIGFLISEVMFPFAEDLVTAHVDLMQTYLPFIPLDILNRIGGVFPFIMGTLVVVFLIFAPRGIAQWWETFKVSYRIWPLISK